ncbi:MAG: GTPase Era [Elusimicrobia bacterium]|nr:GTPase Era [Elusimicrobiota bacterium]MDE2424695.1 GTPase Era [Elusimicrobiota bacterium]
MSEGAPFKAGFVVLLGRPNAGKSTLMNALLGTKLSIVSPHPQTTRHKILGILERPGAQICFLDTPGLLAQPGDPLQSALRRAAAASAREDPDILLLLVEPKAPDAGAMEELAALAKGQHAVILAVNKMDLPGAAAAADAVEKAYAEAVKPAAVARVSALKKLGLEALLADIEARLPQSPPFYEQGRLSDRWERFFAGELIREQLFSLYSDEIPHATAVAVEQFIEGGPADVVRAILYVERDGQKGIILGKGGAALRKLSERSRAAISDFTGRPTELDLWVKVRKNWRRDPRSLREFGYA